MSVCTVYIFFEWEDEAGRGGGDQGQLKKQLGRVGTWGGGGLTNIYFKGLCLI